MRVSSLSVALLLVVSAPNSRADTNPRYRPGDWRAFTSVRYVTSAAFTPEFLYFGTRGGVARYDRNRERWLPALTTAEGLPSNAIRRLAYNPATDELYAETLLGASIYRRAWDEWHSVPDFPESLATGWQPVDLSQYQLPFGFDALDPGFLTDSYLRSYKVTGGLEDSWGNVWLGTWGEFVWKHGFAAFDLVPQRWGLFHDNVEAIWLDSTSVFFGGTNYYSNDGAVTIYDTAAADWHYLEARYTSGFASDHVHAFVGDAERHYLWMATDLGLVRYDRQKEQFRTYGRREGLTDDRVWSLCLDGEILWVGTESGIDGIYLPRDSIFSASTAAVRNARVPTIDVTGQIVWLGTDRGLFRLVKPVAEWQRFAPQDGLSPLGGHIRVIRHDATRVYVGTDHGIAVVDPRGVHHVETYDRSHGLPDDNVFDLAVTDTILWAATRIGLVRFVPSTRERRVFTSDDGLVDPLIQTIVVDGDYLWLGTEHGANRFRWNNPQRID
ncbi:MAG: hypothetical protein HY304_04915 [candidate division Zixibacteria bacterium]|nr:hypothetical protein [candidate division Zixibacteria bacterium]